MNITQTSLVCKAASVKSFRCPDIGAGNITPNWWYSKILTTGGKSDMTAIALLSDLWYLYRSSGEEEHQKDYDYFCKKFNLSTYQIREAFIRLESLDLMKRSVGSIIVQGRKFSNILFVRLNVKKLLEMAPSYIKSSAGNNQDDSDNDNGGSNLLQKERSIFLGSRVGGSKESDLDISNARENKNNLENNRSSESNFVINNFLTQTTQVGEVNSCNNIKRYGFASFYPLTEADISNLRHLAGREFSNRAINEILLSLSRKLPNHDFPHKKAFINYMVKALAYEKRDAVKISNESFRIKNSITSYDIGLKQQEAFLNRIEESRDTSPKMQLSRKLAGILVSGIAYKFLSAASFPDKSIPVDSSTFKILLQTGVELNDHQKRLILAQVQSVYGNHINRLDFNIAGSIKHTKQSDTGDTSLSNKPSSPRLQGVWGKIRTNLIDYYGLGGLNLDRAWFSKLSAEEDEGNKSLTLKAPSNFIKDWIESNYLQLISTICAKENYQLTEVFV
jgi:hypothetical protein